MRTILRSRIHRAPVIEANLEYIGSIAIDEELLQRFAAVAGKKVSVVEPQQWREDRDKCHLRACGFGVHDCEWHSSPQASGHDEVIIVALAGNSPRTAGR